MITIGMILDVYRDTGMDACNLSNSREVFSRFGFNNENDYLSAIKRAFDGGFVIERESGYREQEDDSSFTCRDLVLLAGACGLTNYRSMEPWELIAYKEGADKNQWGHTSTILAFINNAHCTKKKDLRRPSDFNPTISHRDRIRERARGARDISELNLKRR